MYVISMKNENDIWVYVAEFDGPGYTASFNEAKKFDSIKSATDFYSENIDIYKNYTDKAVRKIIFKKKVML